MRVAIISDTHFGDDLCTLVVEPPGQPPRIGPGYASLRRAIGRVDYLVLLGDVLDFSVASFDKAYRHARVFFRQLQQDRLAGQLIYIPGNHDFDIWQIVEHQVNVINQLKQGEVPRAFKRSVPAVIDDRRLNPDQKFTLPDVTANPEWHDNRAKYGNLFLDHITRRPSRVPGARAEGRKLTFNFAYPNLYLVSDAGESVLVTHGHYFEAYWALAADWLVGLGPDLPLERPGEPNLREFVGMNLPLNQLACSGIGQAEPLTDLVRRILREGEGRRATTLARCLAALERQGVAGRPRVSRVRRAAERYVLSYLTRWLLSSIETAEPARYSRLFMDRPQVRERFRRYLHYSQNELAQLSREHGIALPPPTHVVFGHTHQPIPWGTDELVTEVDGRMVRFCNTGGWLRREEHDGTTSFVGAEVVLYETGRGFRSVSLRGADVAESEPAADVALRQSALF